MNRKLQFEDIRFPEVIKIKPNSLVLYEPRKVYTGEEGYDENSRNEETTITKLLPQDKRKNTSSGFLSDRAGARLKTFIKYLFWMSGCYKIQGSKMILRPSGKISFITLTLSSSQVHTDNYIKKQMLNQFITELSKKYVGIKYIWRAERQKNGRIHFHFLVNKFIPWRWCRVVWNRIQAKEGYIAGYQAKFTGMCFEQWLSVNKYTNINKISEYKNSYLKNVNNGWSDPNSIDVVDLRSAKEIYYYISKYLAKNDRGLNDMSVEMKELMKIEGYLYYCSSEISQLSAPVEMLSNKILHDLEIIKRSAPDCIFHDQFFTLIKLPIETLFDLGCYNIYRIFTTTFDDTGGNNLFST